MPEPQIHDVVGTDRTGDDLLSLDNEATAHRDALIGLTLNLWSACIVGNAAPSVIKLRDRMKYPQPGDLVLEWSRASLSRDPDIRRRGLGILITSRTEQIPPDDPDDDDEDNAAWEEAWYVQYGPNPDDVIRWTNCDFLTVLTEYIR